MKLKPYSFRALMLAGSVFLAGVPATSSAAVIRLLTGVDNSNTVLGENSTDPFWTISVQGGAFTAAEVVNSEVICCGMATAGSQAAWISDPSVSAGSASTGWGIGLEAIARRTFDLTGTDISSASLIGLWRVADYRQGIYLNGTLIDPATADSGAGWFSDQSFSLEAGSGLFLPGLNTLELRGTSLNSSWDGFWLDATVTARDTNQGSVPEPASLALLGIGLAGFATMRKKKPAK